MSYENIKLLEALMVKIIYLKFKIIVTFFERIDNHEKAKEERKI